MDPQLICHNCPGVERTLIDGMLHCPRCGSRMAPGADDEVLHLWPKGQPILAVHAPSGTMIEGVIGLTGFNGRDGGWLEIVLPSGESKHVGLNGRGWTFS